MSDQERNDILSSMDNFIERIQQLKGMMLGVSLSGIILAPFAVGISAYLITHPKFLKIIENENEFGFMLIVLLTMVPITSGIWMVTGLRQLRSLGSWNTRYRNYMNKRKSLDESITSKFHLDED